MFQANQSNSPHAYVLFAADMLSKNSASVDKILAAFQVKEPKLVINLLDDTNGVFDNGLDEYAPRDVVPYATAWGCAFETEVAAKEAFFRLVRFMKEVVVPLAEETDALILCSASDSVLTRALLEAIDNMRSTVTIIGFATQVGVVPQSSRMQSPSNVCDRNNICPPLKRHLILYMSPSHPVSYEAGCNLRVKRIELENI